jgi:nicotinate phosphoribosyltransferase
LVHFISLSSVLATHRRSFKASVHLFSCRDTDPVASHFSQAYAYWKLGKENDAAVFDLFFRKPPFGGEFVVFGGLGAAFDFLQHFTFDELDISYLKRIMNDGGHEVDPAFFDWLSKASLKDVKVWAIPEGTPVFPHVPLMRVEGPLAVCQLLETTLLNLVNFASLITTNAVRYRLAAGPTKTLLEFGLRRAQGPDGAMSAARYSYLGGFDATSNVQASRAFEIGVKGTHAHAFVSSFRNLSDLRIRTLKHAKTGKDVDIVELALKYRQELAHEEANEGELAAFLGYAISWPNSFLALVDTYNTLTSGVPNFCAVALALIELGYRPVGVRLDSGDLAYLSKETREMFKKVGSQFKLDSFQRLSITASNEINESTLLSLNQQGHEVDTFGIGTNLVTCQNQTALGGVYKLVMINGSPRLKLSQELSKVTIPGRKEAYRLLDSHGHPILDLMTEVGSPAPKIGERIMCRHPFQETKRAVVVPSKVIALHNLVWDGELKVEVDSSIAIRERVREGIASLRPDHIRFMNPTPYKVSVSSSLYDTFHDLWLNETPVSTIQ